MYGVIKHISVNWLTIPALSAALATFMLTTAVDAGALYKWIDEDGQVRYSDRLPADRARKKHQQLNTQGVVLSTTDGWLSCCR